MPHPEVSVSVTEVRSFKVSVMGAVAKPDRYELKSRATVIDVLAMAEGFTEFAARSRVVVLRSERQPTERHPLRLRQGGFGDARQTNFHVHAGDIVLVP